ncbi:transposase [Streptosporangium sp. V21-05]|uniref:transposase n=1 Tax=Streptosporangium sp. V21-05 TaxID=3446115 RepID=UPI003F53B574
MWVTDITEHSTREGKVYCCVVLDVYSHRVVRWSIDAGQTAALVTNALGMAIHNRTPPPGTLIHSDHGVQFTSWAFTQRAKASSLVPSMGSIGDRFDNAVIESFWGTDADRAAQPKAMEDPGRADKCDLRVPGDLPQPATATQCLRDALFERLVRVRVNQADSTELGVHHPAGFAGQPTVRCDTSDLIKNHYSGCVFQGGYPTWKLARTSHIQYNGKNIKNNIKEHSDHIWDAFNHPSITKPFAPLKKVPGYSLDGLLITRAAGKETYDKNVRVKNGYCQGRYGYTSPFTDADRAPDPVTKMPKQCDEFPYARSVQGAGWNGRDFSLRYIGERANTAAGATQIIFWDRYRVLHGDHFFVEPQRL